METFILIIVLIILAETSFLTIKKVTPLKASKRKIYIDTSALIDSRIVNVAKSGFLTGDIIVLRSVLRELQLLADSKDSEKRTRARAGLEVVSELERTININVEIYADNDGERVKVDEQLLKYAKENRGAILTVDYNLIKVAEAEKIEALNINDLSLAVRTEFFPGEKVDVKIVEKGANPGQGVGHLANGAMVVVDHAANKIGKTITVEFIRFHETSAGRIVFAKIAKKK